MTIRQFPRTVLSVLYIGLASLSLLAGCAPLVAIPPAASADAPSKIPGNQPYRFSPGDTIKLTVYSEDTVTDNYTVDAHGIITVPLIGPVAASGLTKEELQTKITKLFLDGNYLAKPQVTVDIQAMRPFYILGEVKNPGSYSYQPSLDVFQAIAMAGGYSPRAARNKILIDRNEGNRRQRFNADEKTPVLPGDSITIRERIF